ncbi:MAG: hypothetical protein EOO27_21235 [Comamonadaceae bacterium]|nr:MAG: hypothetical protein EOO27_21235 [Comamonadaceae bacterium]
MKAGTYLALLVHNHVNAVKVMPSGEIDRLKATTAHLAALGRELRMFVLPNAAVDPRASELRDLIERIRHEVEMVRAASAAVVRRNHESWETAHA